MHASSIGLGAANPRVAWLTHKHRAVLAVAFLCSTASAREPDVYRHLDANGHIVFSDSPTPGVTSTTYRTDFGRKTATASCKGLDALALDVRGDALAGLLDEAAERHALDPLLLRALVRVESCFDPRARSRAGAEGLAQLMPRTALSLGVRDAFDKHANLDGGARYLARMLQRFGSVELALAAYNAGPGNVDRHGGIPPFPETMRYVKRVDDAWQRYRGLHGHAERLAVVDGD